MFVLSKLFWLLVRPDNLLFLTLLFLCWQQKPRSKSLRIYIVVLALLSYLPLSQLLLYPLERQYAPVAIEALPANVAGIVVLGGGVSTSRSLASKGKDLRVEMGEAGDRLTYFMALAKKYPQAKLVYTSGNGHVFGGDLLEADLAKSLLARMGLDTQRVIWENQSRNTFENAVKSKQLAKPSSEQTWVLITSAFHMPRAQAVFAKQGWGIAAFPVDYQSWQQGSWLSSGLFDQANVYLVSIKEYLGLAAYKLMGRL